MASSRLGNGHKVCAITCKQFDQRRMMRRGEGKNNAGCDEGQGSNEHAMEKRGSDKNETGAARQFFGWTKCSFMVRAGGPATHFRPRRSRMKS